MKKQFFFLTVILIAAFSTAQAQANVEVITAISTAAYAVKATVHPAILANFQMQYPNATEDSWAVNGHGYLVNFKTGSILYHAFLNKKGQVKSQIRYYHEKDLPARVLNIVKRSGGYFTIGLIREVTTQAGTAYLVTIDEGARWKVIRVVGNEMDVFEEHNKG